MKMIIIIMTICLVQVSAAGLAQKVTLNEKETPLQNIIQKIRLQTGYDFIIDAKLLDKAKKITINVNNAGLEDALDAIFKNQQLSYSITDKVVAIEPKEPSFLERLAERWADRDVRGRVVDEQGNPLPGATIQVKGKPGTFRSNEKGEFSIKDVDEDAVLVIRYVGYKQLELPLKDAVMPLEIKLNVATGELEEVKVEYNTGYQKLKPNEVTGSILHITKEQLQRSVSPNILDRLEGIAQGVLFDRRSPGKQDIQIRGRFTLGGRNLDRTGKIAQPMIVLDNFPYEGNINDIDPNNVESIDILKDAAAASIWGARAGNGVIVITTKRGKIDQKPSLSFLSNVSITQKPDIYKAEFISSSDYIDLETFLFNQGFYDAEIGDPNKALTPVVDLLSKMRSGVLGNTEGSSLIDEYRSRDVRDDFLRHVYKKELSQQYSLNFTGGSKNISYALSGSLVDSKNGSGLKNNNSRRQILSSNTSYILTNFLKLDLNVGYTSSIERPNGIAGFGGYQAAGRDLYPYARLLDENGNPAIFEQNLKPEYYYNLGNGRLLDWNYRPLQELTLNDKTNERNALNLGLNAELKITNDLGFKLQYGLQRTSAINSISYDKNSYYARDIINTFTNLTPTSIKYNVPNEGMLDRNTSLILAHNFRTSLNYSKSWKDFHSISVLAGIDVGENKQNAETYLTIFGYDPYLSSALVDYLTPQPTIFGDNRQIQSYSPSFNSTLARTIATYANASYTYKGRYTFSGSARNDRANIFGVKTNQRGKPLWSTGLAWNIAKESFYAIGLIPQLNVRVSYGHQGNYDPSGIANTIIRYVGADLRSNLPYANFTAPNSTLRWEVTKQFNAALEFGLKNGRISGSFEYWNKRATDVFGPAQLDFTTGLASRIINSTDLAGHGFDLSLRTTNVSTTNFNWISNFNFAYSKNTITKLLGRDKQLFAAGNGLVINQNFLAGGYDPNTIFSYQWAGLDPLSGKPLRMYNGQIVDEHFNLGAGNDLSGLVVHGVGIPPYQGNILNNFTYKGFSMSFNIRYGLNFYFRRPALEYITLMYSGLKYSEYASRWQKPGDELFTTVPSFIYPFTGSETFYPNSEVTVERGDYFSINDFILGYNLKKSSLKALPFKSVSVGAQLNNLNLFVYKASKRYDPLNYGNIPSPLAVTFNLGITF